MSRHSNHMKDRVYFTPLPRSVPLFSPFSLLLFIINLVLPLIHFFTVTLLHASANYVNDFNVFFLSSKLQSFTLILDDMTCNKANFKSPLVYIPLLLSLTFCSLCVSLHRFVTQVGCQQVFPLACSSRKSFAD